MTLSDPIENNPMNCVFTRQQVQRDSDALAVDFLTHKHLWETQLLCVWLETLQWGLVNGEAVEILSYVGSCTSVMSINAESLFWKFIQAANFKNLKNKSFPKALKALKAFGGK